MEPGQSSSIAQELFDGKFCDYEFYAIRVAGGDNGLFWQVKTIVKKGATLKQSPCFVVTACMGNENDPTVQAYRDFCKDVLEKSAPGRWLSEKYYLHGRLLAKFIEDKRIIRTICRSIFQFAARYPRQR